MSFVNYESREFLISLLREANVVEEILEDVAEACKLAEYSVFSLAADDIPVTLLAKKLFLTKEEAKALRNVAKERLKGGNMTHIRTQSHRPDFLYSFASCL